MLYPPSEGAILKAMGQLQASERRPLFRFFVVRMISFSLPMQGLKIIEEHCQLCGGAANQSQFM